MKIEKFELNLQSQSSSGQNPWIRVLEFQDDKSLLCGVAFGKPSLLRLKRKSSTEIEQNDLELELGSDSLGVWAGLRSTTSSDTTLCVLNKGMLPSFVASMASKTLKGKNHQELSSFVATETGSMGFWARHSVLMISKDELTLRHDKMPGALVDIALVGDFLFGLSGNEIWREHYLKADKRESLRSDLKGNHKLHRASDGTFWLLGQNDRLLRMNQTDIRAKPTPLKLPGGGEFHLSAASHLDGWLYGTCNGSKTLFRVRLNTVSAEEEIQKICDFSHPVTALLVSETEEKGTLLICTEENSQTQLSVIELIKPEDPELLPPAPAVKKVGAIAGLDSVSALTLEDAEKTCFWLASAGTSSVFRVEL